MSESKSKKISTSSGSIAFSSAAPEIRRPMQSVKVPLSPISSMRARKTATNVAISKESQFNQTIVIPPAIEALFGLPPEERFEEDPSDLDELQRQSDKIVANLRSIQQP